MTDQNNALIVGIARIIDHPSVYMGGPSRNSLRIAKMIVKEFGADLARAVAAQPALGYDTDCPECSGTGQRDSGGTHPWGEPAMMMCDCDAPPPAAPTDNTALVEEQRMKEHYRNCWKAQLERANGLEAALASREPPPACQQEAVTEALSDLLQAVCGETGFAASVRRESGKAYPWPALDLAEAKALRALKGSDNDAA